MKTNPKCKIFFLEHIFVIKIETSIMNQNKKTFSEEMFFCFCKIYWGYNISAVFFSIFTLIYFAENLLNFHCILHHQWLEFSLHTASPMTWIFIAQCITNDLKFHCILHHQWLELSLHNASSMTWTFIALCITNDLNFHCKMRHQRWLTLMIFLI